jgi:hypothetical protein
MTLPMLDTASLSIHHLSLDSFASIQVSHFTYKDPLSKVEQIFKSEVCDPSQVKTAQLTALFAATSPEAKLANIFTSHGRKMIFI